MLGFVPQPNLPRYYKNKKRHCGMVPNPLFNTDWRDKAAPAG